MYHKPQSRINCPFLRGGVGHGVGGQFRAQPNQPYPWPVCVVSEKYFAKFWQCDIPRARKMNETKYLTEPELTHLEAVLQRFGSSAPRNTLLLEMLLKTGARASEMLGTTGRDVNFHHQTIFIRGSKGSADREIPLKDALFARLWHLVQHLPSLDSKLFPIGYNRLGDIWREFRPVKKKLHCLRHTFAIGVYKRTKDIRLVQRVLGHRSLKNTLIYQDYVYNQTEFRRILD